MKRGGVFPLALLCVTLLLGGFAHAQTVTGPGTVQYALDRPDGTRVSLAMVVVGAVNAGGVSVHEWWDKTSPIAAVFSPPPGLAAGQTIDLEGWMTTLSGGRRAVLCERIAFYLDPRGSVLSILPPLKGTLDPSVWPSRGWIPVAPAQSGFQTLSLDGSITLLEDIEPPPVVGDPPAYELAFIPGTIPWAKTLKDGDPVALVGQIVVASRGQVGDCIYIEERDRSAGVRVQTNSPATVDDIVIIGSGTMGTNADGERYVKDGSIRSIGKGSLRPSGMVNREIGGTDFAYDSEDGSGQCGVVGGVGLNNIGSLVRTWGKVTCDGGDYVYIDDGSALGDGTQTLGGDNIGVRVVAGNGVSLPDVEEIVEVTGISSCMIPEGEDEPIRLLRIPTPIMHVKPESLGGSNAYDGHSWEYAKATVSEAVTCAVPGQEIWVAGGEYDGSLSIDKDIRLYGGFDGTELRRDERNWLGNETVLDGSYAGSVVAFSGGVTAYAVIDGFTIQHGTAETGGGISCTESSPTISHNVIFANTTDCAGECTTKGGGIYCESSAPLIIGNVIKQNATGGGWGKGGGIYCESSPNVRIINNTITGNNATEGGGVCINDGSPLLANNIIASNSSGLHAVTTPAQLVSNCVYNPAGLDYWGMDPGPTDIVSDPLFNADGIHLLTGSPCVDAGDTSSDPGIPDIDGGCRVMGGGIDIGADEASGCEWLDVAVSAAPVPAGNQASVVVYVFDRDTGAPPDDPYEVSFSATDGTLVSPEGGSGFTDSSGRTSAVVERADSGYAAVTVSIETCSETLSKTATVFFYVPQDGWPMFMHDPQHTGASLALDSGEAQSLGAPTWTVSVPTPTTNRDHWSGHPDPKGGTTYIFPHPYIDSSPVHAPGCPVIVGAWANGDYSYSQGYIGAFNPTTGASVWRYPSTGYIGGVASTPTIFSVGSEKRVVVGSMDGKIYCLNAETGTLIWSYQTLNRAGTGNGKVLASPTVYQGRVYIGNESSRIYCLDAETTNSGGLLKWSYDLPPYSSSYSDLTGLSSAAIGMVNEEARVYMGSDNGRLYCLSAADSPANRLVWTYPSPPALPLGCIESSPTVYNGNVYVGSSWYIGTNLVAVSADFGTLLPGWDAGYIQHEVRATPAAFDGHVFVGEDTGNLFYRIDALTGQQNPGYPGPFDASLTANLPSPAGSNRYFVGSAALTSAGYGFVGNDNFALYTFSTTDLSAVAPLIGTGSIVCSSPAISYAAEPSCRWVYVLSRVGGGTLMAFRQALN